MNTNLINKIIKIIHAVLFIRLFVLKNLRPEEKTRQKYAKSNPLHTMLSYLKGKNES
jgi:hypothetical protein